MSMIFFNNYFPAIIWASYHFWRFSKIDFNFLGLLLIARALIVLWCFVIREIPKQRAPFYQIIIAWISTILPTFMEWPLHQSFISTLLSTVGILLFSLACIDLGKSFGVSPALRNPIQSGIYQYISHPLYISHVLLELGILIANPSLKNVVVFIFSCGLYYLRTSWEQNLIQMPPIIFHISKESIGTNCQRKA